MNDMIIPEVKEKMNKSIESYEQRLKTVRAGRANPSSLDGVSVDYYGTMTPLKQLATISVPEATQLLIKPFDKGCLKDIEKAIFESNLGYTPNNDGESIRIVIPALTEDRRKELTKKAKKAAEEFKVRIRNERRDANDKLKKMQKDGEITEDELKKGQNDVQKLTDKYVKEIDALLEVKEKDIMAV